MTPSVFDRANAVGKYAAKQLRNEGNHYVHGHSLHSAGSAEQHQPR